jgi:hypothetical protein
MNAAMFAALKPDGLLVIIDDSETLSGGYRPLVENLRIWEVWEWRRTAVPC